jgi:hypothetical protein
MALKTIGSVLFEVSVHDNHEVQYFHDRINIRLLEPLVDHLSHLL